MNCLKRLKQLSTTILQGLIGLALLLLPQQGHALSFTVDSVPANVGDTFSLNLNVADAVDLTSWQFDLAYDPTLLQANLVTEGSFLSSAGSTLFVPGFIDNSAGLIGGVSAFFTDFTTPPSGSGVLASIEFTLLSAGLSPVTASNVFLNLADPTSGGFTVTKGSAGAGSTVPEPSTVLLLLLGGGLLWGVRRWNGQAEISQ
jgi:hypothetical protein